MPHIPASTRTGTWPQRLCRIALLSGLVVLQWSCSGHLMEYPDASKPHSSSFEDRLTALWTDFAVPAEVQKAVSGKAEEIQGIECRNTGGPTHNVPDRFVVYQCTGKLPQSSPEECRARGIAAVLYAVTRKSVKHYGLELSCKDSMVFATWNTLSADPQLFRVLLAVNETHDTRLIYWAP